MQKILDGPRRFSYTAYQNLFQDAIHKSVQSQQNSDFSATKEDALKLAKTDESSEPIFHREDPVRMILVYHHRLTNGKHGFRGEKWWSGLKTELCFIFFQNAAPKTPQDRQGRRGGEMVSRANAASVPHRLA